MLFLTILLPALSPANEPTHSSAPAPAAPPDTAIHVLDLQPRFSNVLTNWPSATIETGTMHRAALHPPQNPDYKWANIMVPQTDDGKTNEFPVPREFALPPPSAPRGMVSIPGGMFVMGYGAMPPGNESVARKLTGYFIDAMDVPGNVWTEVRQWALAHGYTNLAVGQNGAKLAGGEAGPGHPVVAVSWYDCVKWCNARSEMERLVPVYYLNETQKQVYRNGVQDLSSICVDWNANGYRLPTEAEWEKASRGDLSGKLYPWGDILNRDIVNYSGGGGKHAKGTTPIGSFRNKVVETNGQKILVSDENGYGLYDVVGNVYVWCWDWYGPCSTNACGPETGTHRIIRGGCWASMEDTNLACGYRNGMRPGAISPYVGFRCVRRR